MKYMLENGIFWLHINHPKDPIGMPLSSVDLEQRLSKDFGVQVAKNKTGFIHNFDNIKHGPWLFSAHGWYWKKDKQFVKVISKAYTEGYSLSNPQP